MSPDGRRSVLDVGLLDMPTGSTYGCRVTIADDPRQAALARLEAWATTQNPQTRAALVADAWRVGERNVAALARAADVSRDTIYADLTSVGIDYRNREAPSPLTSAAGVDYGGLAARVAQELQRYTLLPEILEVTRANGDLVARLAPELERYSQLQQQVAPAFEAARRMQDWAARMEPYLEATRLLYRNAYRSWVTDPALRHAFTRLAEAARQICPRNWIGVDVDFDRAFDLAAEGLCIVWVPRSEIVQQLLHADCIADRLGVLERNAASLFDDCAGTLEQVDDKALGDYRRAAEEAVAAHRAGLHWAAQALAAALITALFERLFARGRLRWLERERPRDRDDVVLAQLKWSLLVEAGAAIAADVPSFESDAQVPRRFLRNVTLHRITAHQYNLGNSLASLVLAVGLLREAEEMLALSLLERPSA